MREGRPARIEGERTVNRESYALVTDRMVEIMYVSFVSHELWMRTNDRLIRANDRMARNMHASPMSYD